MRHACPAGNVLFALISIFFIYFNAPLSTAISGSTRPIVTKCSVRYLTIDYQSEPLYQMAQGTLAWQPILGSKWSKSADLLSFVALAFQNGSDPFFKIK